MLVYHFSMYLSLSFEPASNFYYVHHDCLQQLIFIIVSQWRQLPDAEKQIYEERAKKLNEENALKYAQEQRSAEERWVTTKWSKLTCATLMT